MENEINFGADRFVMISRALIEKNIGLDAIGLAVWLVCHAEPIAVSRRDARGSIMRLKRGDVPLSLDFIAKRFEMHRDTVRKVLQVLEENGIATRESNQHGTVISFCDFEAITCSRSHRENLSPKKTTTARRQRDDSASTARQQHDDSASTARHSIRIETLEERREKEEEKPEAASEPAASIPDDPDPEYTPEDLFGEFPEEPAAVAAQSPADPPAVAKASPVPSPEPVPSPKKKRAPQIAPNVFPAEEVFLTFPVQGGTAQLTHAKVAEYKASFPGLDIEATMRTYRQRWLDTPRYQPTPAGFFRCLTNWLGRENPVAPSDPNAPPRERCRMNCHWERAATGEWMQWPNDAPFAFGVDAVESAMALPELVSFDDSMRRFMAPRQPPGRLPTDEERAARLAKLQSERRLYTENDSIRICRGMLLEP